MSEIIPVSSIPGASSSGSDGLRGSGFQEFLGDAVGSAGGILGDGLAAVGGLGMSGDLFALVEVQRQLQVEMETVSMISNIDKSRHESKMAAIRNIRTN